MSAKLVIGTHPQDLELNRLLKEAVARFNAMTPEQQEAELRAQRESWVRGEMGLGLDDKR